MLIIVLHHMMWVTFIKLVCPLLTPHIIPLLSLDIKKNYTKKVIRNNLSSFSTIFKDAKRSIQITSSVNPFVYPYMSHMQVGSSSAHRSS